MSFERRMGSLLLFGLSLISLTREAAGLHSSDNLLMAAREGDQIILPCQLPSITPCSSINWKMLPFFTELVKAGKVTHPENNKYRLLKSCSLEITHFKWDDAKEYSCDDGKLSSTVSLRILNVTVKETPADGTMELHCSLNMFHGYVPCNNTELYMLWTTEDNMPIHGKRFTTENLSVCFSKLIFTKKPTDHRRKWKCHVIQNDEFKATISYTTILKDGIEEVFAAVGDSVSVTCSNSSSLSFGGSTERTVGEKPLRDSSSDHDHTEVFHVNKDSPLVINKLTPLHAGDTQCTEFTGQEVVHTKLRLHILDVTAESGPGGDNLTLTCVLTCATECEEDFNLTWSGTKEGQQSTLKKVNNTLIKMLFFPVWPISSAEITCSVLREGALMASKKWRSVNCLLTPAWLGLPLGLLILAGVLCVLLKRKHNKDAAKEQSSIGMTHVYDVIEDEEVQVQPRQAKREAATTANGLYDLLQAVD
ncbi:uncharacterized protein LOC121642390 [Melanotaenia boesemani]|uniref:uncharacterized protein LOC121642390 n=1 Tax=Melanotaenia boesemani TaxID=1250792 RepID=UPI001C03DA5D|nr:uncharacterized protein LOC121642390 [Melanotaenia boesemani]